MEEEFFECFQVHFSENKNEESDTNDNKTLPQIILNCSSRPANNDRGAAVNWVLKTFCSASTEPLLKKWEYMVVCHCYKMKNANLYYYSLSQICFDLKLMSMLEEVQQNEENARTVRYSKKKCHYLLKNRYKYTTSLFHHFINAKYTEFDDSKFIDVTNDNFLLFTDKPVTQEMRDKTVSALLQNEISQTEIQMQQRVKFADLIKAHESFIFEICKQQTNIYIYQMSNFFVSLKIFSLFLIGQSKDSNTDQISHIIENRKDAINKEVHNLQKLIVSQKKRTLSAMNNIDESSVYVPPTKNTRNAHNKTSKTADKRYLYLVCNYICKYCKYISQWSS